MKLLTAICALIALHCYLSGLQDSGSSGSRSSGFTGVKAWPVANPEVMAKNINEIPQWHCLRYFKHDIHLMRRCRNQRFPLMRRVTND